MLIDLHAHLNLCGDVKRIIENSKKSNVSIILCSGIDPESNRLALNFSKKFSIVKASVGLYPIDAFETETAPAKYNVDIEKEIAFIKKNKESIAAIGEIGLDFYTGKDKDAQERLFRRMLSLADELKKPVIIHSRKAEKEALDILKDYENLKIILHCFCGKKKLIVQARDKGYYFTVPTIVVRSQQFSLMAEIVPLSQLFCETDSPFLSPFPNTPNEPAFVAESYKKIAQIKAMELNEVNNIIYNNWQKVFL